MSVYFPPEEVGGCLIDNSWEVCGYTKVSKVLTVPSQCKIGAVRGIGKEAFQGCRQLVKVVIPDTVSSISEGAFRNCPHLEEVVLPEKLVYIGDGAFENCPRLRLITPARVMHPGKHILRGCPRLRDRQGLTLLGSVVMDFEGKNKEVTVPEGVEAIHDEAFRGCTGLRRVRLPETLRRIGDMAFEGCTRLSGIHIPQKLEYVGKWAFRGCDSLYAPGSDFLVADGWLLGYRGRGGELTIPQGVHTVADNLFFRHLLPRITGVTVPQGVTRIGSFAFHWCDSMARVQLPDGLMSIGPHAFSNSGLERLRIPSTVRVLEEGVFSECKKLTEAVLPEGLEAIRGKAFFRCEALRDLRLPRSCTQVAGDAFFKSPALSDSQGFTVVDGVLTDYTGDWNVPVLTIPAGVREIAQSLFDVSRNGVLQTHPGFRKVVFPEGLVKIGKYAFSHCFHLEEVEFPKSLVAVEDGAFRYCDSLWYAQRSASFGEKAFSDTWLEPGSVCRFLGPRLLEEEPRPEENRERIYAMIHHTGPLTSRHLVQWREHLGFDPWVQVWHAVNGQGDGLDISVFPDSRFWQRRGMRKLRYIPFAQARQLAPEGTDQLIVYFLNADKITRSIRAGKPDALDKLPPLGEAKRQELLALAQAVGNRPAQWALESNGKPAPSQMLLTLP